MNEGMTLNLPVAAGGMDRDGRRMGGLMCRC